MTRHHVCMYVCMYVCIVRVRKQLSYTGKCTLVALLRPFIERQLGESSFKYLITYNVYLFIEFRVKMKGSSEAYRDCRTSLWPSQVKLRKLSDIGKYKVNDEEGSPNRSWGNIYVNSNYARIGSVAEEKNEDANEDMLETPWMTEMRRLTVNPDTLSASHLENVQRHAARRKNLPEDHFSQLREKSNRIQSRRRSKPPLADNDEESKRSDRTCDTEEPKLPEKTKALLRRSKQLSASLTRNKPIQRKTSGNV